MNVFYRQSQIEAHIFGHTIKFQHLELASSCSKGDISKEKQILLKFVTVNEIFALHFNTFLLIVGMFLRLCLVNRLTIILFRLPGLNILIVESCIG